MKILKKRFFAAMVDAFVFGSAVACIQLLLPNLLVKAGFLAAFLLLSFSVRDVVFGNASIGKKLFKISVYDKSWGKPKISLLIFRSLGTMTVGYLLMIKAAFTHGEFISVFDWEKSRFGTVVIDNIVFESLSREAKQRGGDFAQSMTDLYGAYLRDTYGDV